MDILQVQSSLVCTRRVEGLMQTSLRVLADAQGKRVVAVDPVGARPGNWVFAVSGSAARYAAGDFSVLTDLTIGGIIDRWVPEEAEASGAAKPRVG
ncbi:MAG TPA: carboxysome peptide B [Gammaproteobacteria bacterium]|nr:carboxysome peptide B [Gammaproteobacteria bacterium]